MKWDSTSGDVDMQEELEGWIMEILHGAMNVHVSASVILDKIATLFRITDSLMLLQRQKGEPGDGMLWNYLDQSQWFVDISGTSALAAGTYRLATLIANRSSKHTLGKNKNDANSIGTAELAWADASRVAAGKHVDPATVSEIPSLT